MIAIGSGFQNAPNEESKAAYSDCPSPIGNSGLPGLSLALQQVIELVQSCDDSLKAVGDARGVFVLHGSMDTECYEKFQKNAEAEVPSAAQEYTSRGQPRGQS